MSLINDMLKDLDERQPMGAHQQAYSTDAVTPAPASTDWLRYLVWGGLLLLLLAAGGYYAWLQGKVPEAAAYQPVQVTPAQKQTDIDPVIEPEIEPVVEPVIEPVVEPVNQTVDAIATEAVTLVDDAVEEPVAYLPLKNTQPDLQAQSQPQSKTGSSGDMTVTPAQQPPLARARSLLANGRLVEAETLLESILQEKPAQRSARELLIGLMLRNNRLEQAREQLVTGRRIYPYSDNLVLLEAEVWQRENRSDDAISILKQHLATGKSGLKPVAMLASLYQKAGRFSEAQPLYRRLVQSQPAEARYWMGLAITLEALQQPASAMQAYRAALQLPGLAGALRDYAGQRLAILEPEVINNE